MTTLKLQILISGLRRFLTKSIVSKSGSYLLMHYQIACSCDSRISLAPSFAGLCHFPQGRGFVQWTGDDSKALMKVCSLCYSSIYHWLIHEL